MDEAAIAAAASIGTSFEQYLLEFALRHGLSAASWPSITNPASFGLPNLRTSASMGSEELAAYENGTLVPDLVTGHQHFAEPDERFPAWARRKRVASIATFREPVARAKSFAFWTLRLKEKEARTAANSTALAALETPACTREVTPEVRAVTPEAKALRSRLGGEKPIAAMPLATPSCSEPAACSCRRGAWPSPCSSARSTSTSRPPATCSTTCRRRG